MSWGQNYFVSTDWQEILPPKMTKNQNAWFYWKSALWATFTHIDTRYYSSKDKQKTPYKKQKTASSYKILPLNGLMTVWGLRRFCSLPLSTNSIEYDFFENDFSKYVFAKHNIFMNALQVETYILCIHNLVFSFSRKVIPTVRPIGNQAHSLLR